LGRAGGGGGDGDAATRRVQGGGVRARRRQAAGALNAADGASHPPDVDRGLLGSRARNRVGDSRKGFGHRVAFSGEESIEGAASRNHEELASASPPENF